MYNLQHIRYAVEVARTASISKAAKNLYMAQPHLSKAIKELEDSLGAPIFNRSPKGVFPTPVGEEFLIHARKILNQLDEMETIFKPDSEQKQRFSFSGPRASYIAYSFCELCNELDTSRDIKLDYRECNSLRAINNVIDNSSNLGIIRFQSSYEQYFLNTLIEKELVYETIWEFKYQLIMSESHPLAANDTIDINDLDNYIELFHGDVSVPALPVAQAKHLAISNMRKKSIAIYERASQFDILIDNNKTYMWVSPLPQDMLSRLNIVQKKAHRPDEEPYKDLLIYRKGYHLTHEDRLFVKKLYNNVAILKNDL